MNLKQYELETQRTFAYRKIPLDEKTTDMLHCAIGIATEVSELVEASITDNEDIVNIGEEIADQCWYISNLARFINLDLSQYEFPISFNFENRRMYVNICSIHQGELLDIFKKSIFYNKELDIQLIETKLIEMLVNLNKLAQCLGLNLEKLLDNNIAKLRIRFPDKFTEENANNRNLDAERKELEK